MSAADNAILDTLTPEERAAIAEEPTEQEMQLMRSSPPGEGDDDEDNDQAQDQASPDSSKPAEQDTPAQDTPPANAGAADQPASDPAPVAERSAPAYEAKLPEDFDSQVQALADAETQAWEQFDSGDIDRAELQRQLRDASTKRADLDKARVKAEISQEMQAQAEQASFRQTVQSFADRVASEIDYRKDAAKQADLDLFMKSLASDDANADKSYEWFLHEAHKRVKALHGVATAASTKPDPKAALQAAREQRKPPVGAAPATLAQVPGADGPGDVGSEFVDLDALDGQELEDAIAKLSPAQRAKYLAGQ